MHTYPHKIENGKGEVLTFFGVVRDRDGDRMEVELLAPPDVGTPMHLHHLQEEAMTVVAGRLGLQFAGEQPRYAGPGETIIRSGVLGTAGGTLVRRTPSRPLPARGRSSTARYLRALARRECLDPPDAARWRSPARPLRLRTSAAHPRPCRKTRAATPGRSRTPAGR